MDSSTVICWTSSLKFCHIRGIGLILSLLWKILLANITDPHQIPHYLAFDLSLHCLPMTLLWGSRLSKLWLISLQTQRWLQETGVWFTNSFMWNSCESMPSFKDLHRLWGYGLILSQFENWVPLNPVLGGKGAKNTVLKYFYKSEFKKQFSLKL